MKNTIKLPEFDFDFENYWFYRNGGYRVDKRTREGKEVVQDALNMDMDRHIKVGYEFDLHPALVCTSPKTRRKLFTFEYLN